jgi:hypothetical protein
MHFSIYGLEVGPGMAAAGLLGYFCWELGRLWFAMRSEFWPFVMGTIEDVGIDNRPDSDGDDFFVPRLRYVYKVGVEMYVGKRLAFRPKGSGSYENVVSVLEGITTKKSHRVYYHPKHPQISVLKPGPRLANYLVLIVVFVLACVAFGVYTSHSP